MAGWGKGDRDRSLTLFITAAAEETRQQGRGGGLLILVDEYL